MLSIEKNDAKSKMLADKLRRVQKVKYPSQVPVSAF
jgi:hypothetical protein